ncbi:assimilatory sulfite reductase (NADPH) flavoprotein subunit [Puniceicoccaceae bacterium K14]|nr:assimilatory sulfite reductase (NADPH) flavoprotein subunit [Puniceicoccaceae bacterium K14]
MSQSPIQQIPSDAPFTPEQAQSLNSILSTASTEQIFWLRGYLAGVSPAGAVAAPAPTASVPLTILFGSESGNGEGLAEKFKGQAAKAGFAAKLVDMADLSIDGLAKIENLLVIVSTWGEGDPPSRAEDFYDKFMSDAAPKLEKTRFSVCGLGDTSYVDFCKMSKDFDKRLEALGAERIADRVDCDVDFEGPSQAWADGAIAKLKEICKPEGGAAPAGGLAVAASAPTIQYGKSNPFPAPLLNKIDLNGTGSAKETIHAEISIEGSGLTYDAGDALAVVPLNSDDLVDEFLAITKIDGRENVAFQDELSVQFRKVLKENLDLRTVSKLLLKKYAKISANDDLLEKVEDATWVKEYTWGRDWVDVIKDFPTHGMRAGDFIRLLRALSPRLYSIASSVKAHPGEVHLTVGAVRYEAYGRKKKGVCSTFIADEWAEGEVAGVYFHHNKNFKLPANTDTDVIMVGPGTGIAPFRSFVEERVATNAAGKNWLFFGDQKYTYDFLYQTEWQDYLKNGNLAKLDLAFSRDQPEKIYVQDRMRENGKELWEWINKGAYFYVCGDASRMAKDVHQALLDIFQEHGGMSSDEATKYLKQMQKDRRYGRDVY